MKKETIKRIRLIYGIVLSLSAVIAGICLIAACIGIYQSGGDQTYTAPKVTEAFSGIAVPVYLCLALVVGGFILDFALPAESKKRKPEKNHAATLQRLLEKRDLESCEPALGQAIIKEQSMRRLHTCISIVLLIIGSIVFLSYGANPANFHQSQINGSMVSAMWVLLPCLAVPFGYAVFSAYFTRASLQRQIALVKQIPAGEKKAEAPAKQETGKALLIARCVLVCLAVVLLVYGFFAGGTKDVLTKAINICTECVGLG